MWRLVQLWLLGWPVKGGEPRVEEASPLLGHVAQHCNMQTLHAGDDEDMT